MITMRTQMSTELSGIKWLAQFETKERLMTHLRRELQENLGRHKVDFERCRRINERNLSQEDQEELAQIKQVLKRRIREYKVLIHNNDQFK